MLTFHICKLNVSFYIYQLPYSGFSVGQAQEEMARGLVPGTTSTLNFGGKSLSLPSDVPADICGQVYIIANIDSGKMSW